MPFVARCRRDGHIEMARTRPILDICMDEHDIKSHRDRSGEHTLWTIVVVSHSVFYNLQKLSQTSAFWRAIRQKFPCFSGLVVGRIAFMQTDGK